MDLTDALRIAPHEVVALVGGGGKTTSMYRLCAEAAARGRRAVATGTARFTEPATGHALPMVMEEDEGLLLEGVSRHLADNPAVIATSGRGSKERLLPVSYGAIESLARIAGVDLVAVEADGSARRPFKAPAGHEPPIPPAASLVIAVVGADVFGLALSDAAVHRPERVMALTGAAAGLLVTPLIVATVLGHTEGGRKDVPEGARFAVLINKVGPSRLPAAMETARLLAASGVETIVLAQVREAQPVVEVIISR